MIKFLKVRDVASPEREPGNAGFDFFVPRFNMQFLDDCAKEAEKNPNAGCFFEKDDNDEWAIVLNPGQQVSIPSGIKCNIDVGMPLSSYGLGADLVVENKSGVSTKYGLDVLALEIDENYQGEVHLSVMNTSDRKYRIKENMKLVQIVPRVYMTGAAQVVSLPEVAKEGEATSTLEAFYEDFKWSNRGEGGFGSTSERPKNS